MNNIISIKFGTPYYGWMPVELSYYDFKLQFDASNVFNNPLDDLYRALINLHTNKTKEIMWWLEPFTYFFTIVNKGQEYTLTIFQAEDMDEERQVVK